MDIIYICNDFSFKEAGFYCVKAFINGEFAASMCWQIYYYLRYVRGMDGEHWRWVELVLVYAVIFAILTLIELNLKKDLEELHITRRELLVVIIIAASVFAMSNLSYLDQNGLFSGSFVMDIFYYPYTCRSEWYCSAVCISYSGKRSSDPV